MYVHFRMRCLNFQQKWMKMFKFWCWIYCLKVWTHLQFLHVYQIEAMNKAIDTNIKLPPLIIFFFFFLKQAAEHRQTNTWIPFWISGFRLWALAERLNWLNESAHFWADHHPSSTKPHLSWSILVSPGMMPTLSDGYVRKAPKLLCRSWPWHLLFRAYVSSLLNLPCGGWGSGGLHSWQVVWS